MGALTSSLSEIVRDSGKKTVAVVDFTDLQGCVTELGRYMAEDVSVALVNNAKGIEVIDRTNLRVLMQEHKLASTGIIDPATARKLGQVAGVDALVTGTITPIGDSVHVSAKVLDTVSAKMLGGTTVDLPKTAPVQELIAKGVMNCGQPDSSQMDSSPAADAERSPPPRNTNEVRGRIGVSISTDPATAKLGAKLLSVESNGPAANAGLQPGDQIVSIDGYLIKDGNDLRNVISPLEPGKTARVTYMRNGKQSTVIVGIVAPIAAGQIEDILISIPSCRRDGDWIRCFGSVVNGSKERRTFRLNTEASYMADNLGNQSKEQNPAASKRVHRSILWASGIVRPVETNSRCYVNHFSYS